MPRDASFIVVSYDIRDDRRRARVFKAMQDFGKRVQYSVFECELRPRDYTRLVDRVFKLILPEEDSVRLYYLCETCVPKIRSLGADKVERIRDFYGVEEPT